MEDLSLARLDAVRVAIEQATTVQELKDVLDVSKAYAVYAQQHKLGEEIKQRISDYILTAKIKLGQMIIAAKAAGQITHDHKPDHVVPGGNNEKFKLADAGISRKLSSEAQRLAKGQSPKKSRAPVKPHYREPEIENWFDQGLNNSQIADKTGCSKRIVDDTVEHIRIRRAAQAQIDPATLSFTAQQKLQLAIKQHAKKLADSYQANIQEEVNRRIRLVMERWQAQQDDAKRIIESRKGFMSAKTYRQILACLHPDWVTDARQKARYQDAFIAFSKLEKFLLDEKESPTQFAPPLPKTPAEWAELKRKAAEAARAKRQQSALAKARRSR